MTQPVLRTLRLTLRPFRMDDADDLHEVLRDQHTMRYWDTAHTDIAESRAFVRATMDAPADITCDFVIERHGRAIGKAGMWRIPEIGFFLHPAHQRQGLMREALCRIIPHLFATYDVSALTADVDPENTASLRLLEGIGFHRTGSAENTIEIAGRMCHSIYLALARADAPPG